MGTQESPPLAVGTRLDAYEVVEVIEQGRYSYCYLARDAAGTEVLIKEFLPHEFAFRDGEIVRPREADDKTPLRFWLRSFLDKAVLLHKLNHPGLIRVLKQFEANGTGYYVTERVAGQSLEAILQRDGALSEAQLRRLLAPLLSGLEQAHAVGLLHRDIRPENVLVRADDSAVLTNFGVLRAPIRFKARTVFSAGAPPYAAPEEFFMAGPHGPWTDLYALGATAYRVVTGQPPPDARTRASGPTLAPVAMKAKVRVSDSVAAAIDETLHLAAEQRPQSVAAWREALQGAAGQEAEPAAADAGMPAAEYGAAPKRSSGMVMVIGAVVVVVGAAAAYFALHSPGGQDNTSAAPQRAAAAQPAPAAQQDAAAPAQPGAAATAAASAQPANGGDLDRLAMDLMSREKKLADAREQLQAQQQAAQEAKAAAASKPAAAAAAQPPAQAEAEAADHLKQLQAEVERLRKDKEAQPSTATTVASAAPASRSGPDWPTWYREATGSIRQNLHYPQKSLQAGEEGDLLVKVHLRRDGSILRTDLAQRSPYSALNQEALEVFSRIGRFAPLPPDYQPSSAEVDLSMPINFKLSD